MRKEHVFIICLAFLAAMLFGFGSRAGLALQDLIRGVAPGGAPAAPGGGLDAIVGTVVNGAAAKNVPVYSQYPLNLKNELTIAAGTADGIGVGDAAVTDGFLVGTVAAVFERSAVIRTVFDGRFQLPVRVGGSAADALLSGGVNPTLTLIATEASVGEGDQVISAAAGMPYGLPLGTLRGLHDAGDRVFREAALQVPYNPGTLRQITIIPYSGR